MGKTDFLAVFQAVWGRWDLGCGRFFRRPVFSKGGIYSGLTLNQDKATKPQTVDSMARRGNAVPV